MVARAAVSAVPPSPLQLLAMVAEVAGILSELEAGAGACPEASAGVHEYQGIGGPCRHCGASMPAGVTRQAPAAAAASHVAAIGSCDCELCRG